MQNEDKFHAKIKYSYLPRARDINALFDPPDKFMASNTPVDSSTMSPLLTVTNAASSLVLIGL